MISLNLKLTCSIEWLKCEITGEIMELGEYATNYPFP